MTNWRTYLQDETVSDRVARVLFEESWNAGGGEGRGRDRRTNTFTTRDDCRHAADQIIADHRLDPDNPGPDVFIDELITPGSANPPLR